MNQVPTYLVDIIGEVVASVKADVLATIIKNESAALGTQSLIQTINYQYGHKSELIETLFQMDKSDPAAYQKYPLIYLVLDFKEIIDDSKSYFGTAVLNILIMHSSELSYKTTERYLNVFKPVLYPLYISLLNQIPKHKAFSVYGNPKHEKYDRPLVGVPAAIEGNKLLINEYVDAIEIANLNLLLNYQTCIN